MKKERPESDADKTHDINLACPYKASNHDHRQLRKQKRRSGFGRSVPLGHVNGVVRPVTLQKLPGKQVVQAVVVEHPTQTIDRHV